MLSEHIGPEYDILGTRELIPEAPQGVMEPDSLCPLTELRQLLKSLGREWTAEEKRFFEENLPFALDPNLHTESVMTPTKIQGIVAKNFYITVLEIPDHHLYKFQQ